MVHFKHTLKYVGIWGSLFFLVHKLSAGDDLQDDWLTFHRHLLRISSVRVHYFAIMRVYCDKTPVKQLMLTKVSKTGVLKVIVTI